MRYPKLRELKEAIKALILGPFTTKYPKVPHIPFPAFRGRPVPNDDECIACGACSIFCPARAIEIKENLDKTPATREVIWHYDICVFCAQCERLCTTLKGVHLGQEFDLTAFDRTLLFAKIEKPLVLCEDCGNIIAPKAQLLWMIKKLGPLASGNFNLIYTSQKELKLSEDLSTGLPTPPVQRPDLYRVLCPKCRHQVLVFNQTGKQS